MHPLLKAIDSYKISHWKFLREGTTHIESYIESRGFAKPFFTEPELVMMGTRMFIQKYLSTPMTMADIEQFAPLIKAHGLPFNYQGFKDIVQKHGGYTPIRIEALDEGTITPIHVPMTQVINKDDTLPWVGGWIETAMLRSIWYPTTVATLSREAKKIIKKYLEKTADDTSGLLFKLHDFGARGATSQEQAEIGGLAHLVNFRGTDTVEALFSVQEHYTLTDDVAGYSIPATEHSISTLYGKEGERDYADRVISMIENGAPLAAIVADTYDLYNFITNVLGAWHYDRIRNLKGTLVVRPDSGNPIEITLKVIELLDKDFGHTVNSKGYKVLPPYLRIIQGDGITLQMIEDILNNFELHGWSADNIAFGMGGGLLQSVTRDTLKFADKANQAVLEFAPNMRRELLLQKDPITDPGKASKKGHQTVYRDEAGVIRSEHTTDSTKNRKGLLKPIYDMAWGEGMMNHTEPSFDVIRKNAEVL